MIQTSEDITENGSDIMSIIILESYVVCKDSVYREKFINLLVTLLENITSGGERDFFDQSVYAASKIHATVVVNYKLLKALVHVCEENADERLISPIRKLISKEGIRLEEDSNVFDKHLYIRYLAALYRSVDKDAGYELKAYLGDEHYFFRTFVRNELDEKKTIPCPIKDKWELWI